MWKRENESIPSTALVHPRSYNNLNIIISCRSLKIYYRPIKRTNLKIFISTDMILKENFQVPFFIRNNSSQFQVEIFNCAFNAKCNGLSYGPLMGSREKRKWINIALSSCSSLNHHHLSPNCELSCSSSRPSSLKLELKNTWKSGSL